MADQSPLNRTNTGALTNVASSNTSVTILASNNSRSGAYFYNDSTQVLYLALTSAAASSSAYTVQLAAGQFYELPQAPVWTGVITGIWASANGNLRVTELS